MIIKYEEVANLYDPGLNPILSLNLCLGIVVPLYFSFGILVQRGNWEREERCCSFPPSGNEIWYGIFVSGDGWPLHLAWKKELTNTFFKT